MANDGSNDLRIREGVGFDYGTHGITMRKYKQENLWASTEGTVVLIRLSEMYYILAECAATPEEAAGYLNKVREMRGIDPTVCTETNRLNEIEKEYRKNFMEKDSCSISINAMGILLFYIVRSVI